MPLGGKMTPKIYEKPTNMEVNNLQRKASIPLCVSIVLDVKTGGRVPKICLQESTTLPNAKKNAMSYSVPCIRYSLALAMPSSRGGRSEAQQNAPRQGAVLPSTACQTSHNVVPTSCQRSAQKKKVTLSLALSLYFFFFQDLPFTP